MKSFNNVQLIGNLGGAPEIRTTKAGKKVASLRVATNRTTKSADGTVTEVADWHNISIFNENLVGIIEQYLEKGDRVFLGGRLQTRQYDDNGETKYFTEIIANELMMLGGTPATE